MKFTIALLLAATPIAQSFSQNAFLANSAKLRTISSLQATPEKDKTTDVTKRVDRFRNAVGYSKSLETGFDGCITYLEESDPEARGCMLVTAAIDSATRRDDNKPLFIQTVTEIAESLSPLFAENIEWYVNYTCCSSAPRLKELCCKF